MGQVINVTSTVVGESAFFEADRSLSGQDGGSYDSPEATEGDQSFGAKLAAALFESDPLIAGVFVASNSIVARRQAGWDDAGLGAASAVIRNFFVFYRD